MLCLPILFTAGMTLLDTIDGAFMNVAYGWAFARPVRRMFFNIVITALSVAMAFFIGSIELFGLLGQEFNLTGGIWDWTDNFDLNSAGFIIVGGFVVIWAVAALIWRFGRIEERWEAGAVKSRVGNDAAPVCPFGRPSIGITGLAGPSGAGTQLNQP